LILNSIPHYEKSPFVNPVAKIFSQLQPVDALSSTEIFLKVLLRGTFKKISGF
jgi:hypothetical protein